MAVRQSNAIHLLGGGHYYVYEPDARDRIIVNCGSPVSDAVRVEASLKLSRDEARQLGRALVEAADGGSA